MQACRARRAAYVGDDADRNDGAWAHAMRTMASLRTPRILGSTDATARGHAPVPRSRMTGSRPLTEDARVAAPYRLMIEGAAASVAARIV